MAERDSFATFLSRLDAEEGDAAQEVFRRFARQLLSLARRHFDKVLAHKADPEGVVQSALKSFFVRHREGKLAVGSWNALWGLLTLITLRKCADRVEYHRAARRDVRRETSSTGEGVTPPLALDRQPSPHEAAVLAETVEQLFRDADADERPVLELSLQGYTAAEVSLQLGRALRTVHRLREQLRKRLERMQRAG